VPHARTKLIPNHDGSRRLPGRRHAPVFDLQTASMLDHSLQSLQAGSCYRNTPHVLLLHDFMVDNARLCHCTLASGRSTR